MDHGPERPRPHAAVRGRQERLAGNNEAGTAVGRVAVIMPTYNERENLEAMTGRVRAAVPEADLLVVDDNSPDGTGELADKLAAEDSHVRVLHRPGKGGLGAAYLAGFSWALEQDYGAVVEMDADGSHQPEQLPLLLDALRHADLVLGSRWVPGGRVVNWPKSREVLSRGANIYARLMLGHPAQGRYRRVPGLPRGHAAGDPAGRDPVAGLLLSGRSRPPRPERGAAGRGSAHHLRGAGARLQQDEQVDHGGGVLADRALGTGVPLGVPARGPPRRALSARRFPGSAAR